MRRTVDDEVEVGVGLNRIAQGMTFPPQPAVAAVQVGGAVPQSSRSSRSASGELPARLSSAGVYSTASVGRASASSQRADSSTLWSNPSVSTFRNAGASPSAAKYPSSPTDVRSWLSSGIWPS